MQFGFFSGAHSSEITTVLVWESRRAGDLQLAWLGACMRREGSPLV